MKRACFVCLSLGLGLVLGLAGCGGNAAASSSTGNNGSGGGSAPAPGTVGTVLVPDGAKGVAVIHLEDSNGNLLSAPAVAYFAASGGPVGVIAEPPDFSQGLVLTPQGLQTFNNALTSPAMAETLALQTPGTPLAAATIADSSFAWSVYSQAWASTCFTGGLHITSAGADVSYGPTGVVAYVSAPDGTTVLARGPGANGRPAFVQAYTTTATTSPHAYSYSFDGSSVNTSPSSVTGRGAMAYNPKTTTTVVIGSGDGTLTTIVNLGANQVVGAGSLPAAPAVTSIAYAPSGQYAVVATTAGLFTVTVDPATGAATVLAGPALPGYVGSDQQNYVLDHAQSIGISADGKFLVALTDQPSAANGTLVVMPLDASGNPGAAAETVSGLAAAANADVLLVH
ncbi:MAG TPA: hypothetical protein VE996_05540 [Terriglobales bacterium]|nr:hypothetical protein [Terriglobales bacterium]